MPGETDQVKWRGVRPIDGIRGIWPSIDAVRVYRNGTLNGAGYSIFYTVPVGKILFISDSMLSSKLSADAATFSYLIVRDAGAATKLYLYMFQFQIAGQQSVGTNYIVALECQAGWTVSVRNSAANISSYGVFHGWLEDA
ncbi:hypothetical protein LCGC14_1164360 [marine sediment metagenome]|uniref:Uncharacterized protein n=1 Tax=marine sediment metagenome TaxID=412755 RepID=A0A0F9LWS0_9ZZZZ